MDNYFVNLNHRELLAISGEDSESFLQGQLSCDLSELSEYDSCLGCLCDNKGRVLASFTLWKIKNVFYLEMETGVAVIAEQHLKKYSVFYKSELAIKTTEFDRIGLIGVESLNYLESLLPEIPSSENQITLSSAEGIFLRMADAKNLRYELWQSKKTNSELLPQEGKLEAWKVFDQKQGLYSLQAEDSGLYTPQELNYDQLGHISFTKGCYTGQEIVARMHYRGKAKKRLYLLEVHADSSPEKNMIISTEDDKTVGKIIDIASIAKNLYQIQAIAKEFNNLDLRIKEIKNSKLKLISY